MIFLSTLSLRRATPERLSNALKHLHFYPRSPCGERHQPGKSHKLARLFLSTLSLRRATPRTGLTCGGGRFLSTLSLRRATAIDVFLAVWAVISIHALLAESDRGRHIVNTRTKNFYPRSPCGERPFDRDYQPGTQIISIHALLAESDVLIIAVVQKLSDFYPRSPCGERQYPTSKRSYFSNFYPRSPCGERLYPMLLMFLC